MLVCTWYAGELERHQVRQHCDVGCRCSFYSTVTSEAQRSVVVAMCVTGYNVLRGMHVSKPLIIGCDNAKKARTHRSDLFFKVVYVVGAPSRHRQNFLFFSCLHSKFNSEEGPRKWITGKILAAPYAKLISCSPKKRIIHTS
jgi:hypothetical protein